MYVPLDAATAARAAIALAASVLWRLYYGGFRFAQMEREQHHRTPSVTGPPTCSSSAGRTAKLYRMKQQSQDQQTQSPNEASAKDASQASQGWPEELCQDPR